MVKIVVLLAATLLSCVRVAEGRAERDAEVGHASIAELTVDVDQGHAAVRALEPSRVHLWGNAPALRVRLTASGPGEVELFVENTLADVHAVARGEALVDSGVGTKHTFRVPFAAAGEVVVDIAAPDGDMAAPFRYAMYADVQEAIDRVQDIYARMNREEGIRFALMAGDQTQTGTPNQLERFQRELATLRFPVFGTLGNHELGDSAVPYHAYFGRGSSSFGFKGARFTLLDSASATLDPIVYDWLDGWLDQGRDRVHVVAMHIPPIDPIGVRSGSFASRNEANKLLSRLARGRVDLTLYGHVHSYYEFDNAGIPAFIAGGGGAIPERFDAIGRHFLVVDVEPTRQTQNVTLVRVDE